MDNSKSFYYWIASLPAAAASVPPPIVLNNLAVSYKRKVVLDLTSSADLEEIIPLIDVSLTKIIL
jgi:hypothetical protein